MTLCARFNGGNNAGHTVVHQGKKYAFHQLPCGILHDKCLNLLGNGVVVNLEGLFKEIKALDGLKWEGRVFVSDRAQLVTNAHVALDTKREEGDQSIGTTKRGIGPTYSTKASRSGLRVGDLLDFSTFQAKYNALMKSIGK